MNKIKIIKSEEMNKHKITKVIEKKYLNDLLNKPIKIKNKNDISNKPNGFWLSINEGWEKWCKSEMPEWIENSTIAELKFNPSYNIMLIEEVNDIIGAWNDYLNESGFKSKYPKGDSIMCFYDENYNICNFWSWLINKYKLTGIYLTNEGEWKTRMTTFLYGWDCESIVIFIPEIINKEKTIEIKNE